MTSSTNKTQHLKYKKTISGPLIVCVGFFISVASTLFFTVGYCSISERNGNIESIILFFIILGVGIHYTISLYCNLSFLRGLKEHDPRLFIPWFWIKGVEIAALLIGSIAIWSPMWTPFGFIFMTIAMYSFVCVWKTYEDIKKNSQIPYIIQYSPFLDQPPSYEELKLDSA